MDPLDDFVRTDFSAEGLTAPVYWAGQGPGVVVIHEVPGITPRVAAFARAVVGAGFRVAMPSLLGEPGRPMSAGYAMASLGRVCVAEAFTAFALGRTPPAARFCRALARALHAEVGGVGVGAVGMCFSGGYALAMMVDGPVVAPVLSQPSMPFSALPGRSAALDLSPEDEARVVEAVRAGCPVMALRYAEDPLVGKRFERLRALFGDQLRAIELPGLGHSVLTEQRDEGAVAAVLDFLRARLGAAAG